MRRMIPGVMLSVSFFAGVFGCGPGSPSDQANGDSSVAEKEMSGMRTGPIAGTTPTSQTPTTAFPLPTPDTPTRAEKPVAGADQVVMKPMNPEAPERLKDLETWAQQGFPGGNDPLVRALNDPDEGVRARAQELMEGNWSTAIAARYSAPR